MATQNHILEINNLSIGLPKKADRKFAVEKANIKVLCADKKERKESVYCYE